MLFPDKHPTTLVRLSADLKRKGYQLNFRREAVWLFCIERQQLIMPEDFAVDESYYIEDMENADGDRILYAISLSKGGRGILVDASNAYTDNISYELEQKLQWQYPQFSQTFTQKQPL